MKKNIYILTMLIGLLSVSCEDFLDVNTDPNNPTSVTPDLILPLGQYYTAEYVQEDRGLSHLGNMMMFNWGEANGFSWYDEEFKYLVTNTFYDALFNDAYSRAMKQYNVLTGLEPEYDYYKAIGMIMKAYHFQILVDLFGDIPYTEALQRGLNPTPVYDDASAVYTGLLTDLSAAIDLIEAGEEADAIEEIGDEDVMFGGDMTMWKQFANTVKLRILTRLSDVEDAAVITAELAAITEEGSGFLAVDAAINPGYVDGEADKQNLMWDQLGWDYTGTVAMSNDATCATQYILDYLSNTNDPRINYIYEMPDDGHLGVDQGADNNDEALGPDFVSNIGPGILKAADMDAVILTLAEINFNQAELAEKGLLAGDAASFYYSGISASMDYLGVHDTLEAKYLQQTTTANVLYESASDKLEAIITQKWIATNGITAEQSWFDYSRTGYPLNLPVSTLATTPSGDRPVRLFYPSSEETTNSGNLPEQPNAFTDKIFWANN